MKSKHFVQIIVESDHPFSTEDEAMNYGEHAVKLIKSAIAASKRANITTSIHVFSDVPTKG